jgi:hypothetical protein
METNTNTVATKVNTNELGVSPTFDELYKWIDSECPVITYERYTDQRPKREHQEYREAYYIYLNEFENC